MTTIEYPITFFFTRDLEKTAAFYQDVIGLELARDQGDCRIFRAGERGFVGFCQRDLTMDTPHGVIFTLVTDDVDGWYYKLVEKGVTFENPPSLNPKYNIYHCFLHDPNGYLIEIQRFNESLE